jgi:3-deoxy-D-manno-octulosonic-acid transferase
MYWLYSLCLSVGLLLYLPVFVVKRILPGRYTLALRERLGWVPRAPAPSGLPRLWIHAVSVGEVVAAAPLIHALRERRPNLRIILSTVTPTGAKVADELFRGEVTRIIFPVDLAFAMRRAVRGIAPHGVIAMETELWPHLFRELKRKGIPSMIANGRISDRSFRRYRWARLFLRRLFSGITLLAMQTEEDARRIMVLGAAPERVVITGNLKADALPGDDGMERLWQRLLGLHGEEPVWVVGSTHRGEEAIILDVFHRLHRDDPRIVLVLAPRHPERVPEIESLIRDRGLKSVRRSQLPRAQSQGAVILLDSVGELAQVYRIADVVFVGGSLVPFGGQNIMEPALRRKPVLFGPHVMNFREVAGLLKQAGGGLQVEDGDGLEAAVRRLLRDQPERIQMGEAAYQAVRTRQGAVLKTVELIERYLLPSPATSTEESPEAS